MTELSETTFSSQNPSSSAKPSFGRSSAGRNWSLNAHLWQPPTDMYETESSVVVVVEIAGMKESEFVISLEKRTLVISGERGHHSVNGAYHQLEILSGEFISLVELPAPVQYDKVSADYADGFLTITLPKTEIVRVEIINKDDANG
ncbi:MAG TPA: Hsp20/alpha crystallin family protein [Anaerolineales bacterium]|nr:Hsp20/alpha crystallin family protein [Anaerolineales bacterium]